MAAMPLGEAITTSSLPSICKPCLVLASPEDPEGAAAWIKSHPSEVVVMEVSHFATTKHSSEAQQRFLDLIESTVGPW